MRWFAAAALLVFGLAGTFVPAVHALEEAEEFNEFVVLVESALEAGEDPPQGEPHDELECLDCLAATASILPTAAPSPLVPSAPVLVPEALVPALPAAPAPAILPPARAPPAG
ncbi:MAG: hypothetical protein EA352_01890 [Gemmatimonadales bacterium]|nr:MAG: hypothetical protein EA352_01890 [Gemmatimonadales bacterium]